MNRHIKNTVSICISFLFLVLQGCNSKSEMGVEMSPLKKLEVEQVKPLHWWVGFESEELQLLVKSNQIQGMKVTVNTPSVEITKVHNADSPNYLFIDLKIKKNTAPGKIQLLFSSQDNESYSLDYELKARTKSALDYKGFNSEDAIYLITPDRFANANPGNDIQPNLQEQKINRNDDYARHGGDIQGITDHLDYIHDMGFTAVWSCPLRTNDMKKGSYHGYAITDHYEVDPRFGTMEEFKTLVEEAKKRGIKFIMDQIVNHCGLYHWWMEDLPFKDWINYQDEFLSGKPTKYSNHRRTINQDNYASEIDKKEMTDGWFVETMPDLNHKNPFMAKFIIQNSIWWVEELGLGGIRQDTYPYADKTFLSNWAGAIMNEYPNFSIVGEEWSYNPLLIGYWQNDRNHKQGYVSNLTSTMDFAMLENIKKGISQDESWDKGLIKIYDGLANDFNYPNPKGIMAMMDNHDMSRIYTELKGDIIQTKMALSTLLMLPRVPQIYYGTEILMQDFDKPGDHGLVRTDFPGGWAEDQVNAFSGEGLNKDQKDMQHYLKTLLNFRKNSSAIHHGETVHFAPKSGVYFLFRIKKDDIVFLILNKNETPISIDLNRFKELNLIGKTFQNVLKDEAFEWQETLKLSKKGSYIFSSIPK
mgnify:FL=1